MKECRVKDICIKGSSNLKQKDVEGNVVDTLSDELKTESSRAVYYLNPVVCDYL